MRELELARSDDAFVAEVPFDKDTVPLDDAITLHGKEALVDTALVLLVPFPYTASTVAVAAAALLERVIVALPVPLMWVRVMVATTPPSDAVLLAFAVTLVDAMLVEAIKGSVLQMRY